MIKMENYQNNNEFAEMVQYLRHEGLRMKGKMKRFESELVYRTKTEYGYLARLLADAVAAD